MAVKLFTVCQLYQMAQIHDSDPIADMFDHSQIMGDKQIGQLFGLLQIFQHVDNLCLNGHIQSRYRLITDDKSRIYCQRSGNADPLTLSTGKFVGKPIIKLSI